MFLTLKNDKFSLWFLSLSDLRISSAGKHIRIIRIKIFNLKDDSIFYKIDKIKVSWEGTKFVSFPVRIIKS